MRGLDTNVLVRFLVQDEPLQAQLAELDISKAVARNERILIQPVVLCELVWVLETAYDIRRVEVAETLERILRTAQFEIPRKEAVWGALSDYRSGKADFADYFIGRANAEDGADETMTFDRGLKGSPRFRLLVP